MAYITPVYHILMLFHWLKGSWNKPAKYKKLQKYCSYCTDNHAITNVCFFALNEFHNEIYTKKCLQWIKHNIKSLSITEMLMWCVRNNKRQKSASYSKLQKVDNRLNRKRAKRNKTTFINQNKSQLTTKYIVEEMQSIWNYFCTTGIFILRLEICR